MRARVLLLSVALLGCGAHPATDSTNGIARSPNADPTDHASEVEVPIEPANTESPQIDPGPWRAEVRASPATFVEGADFDSVSLDRLFHTRRAQLAACFDEAREGTPEGSALRMRFVIHPLGRIVDLSALAVAPGLEAVAPCLIRLLGHLYVVGGLDGPATYDVELRLHRAPIEPAREPGECPVHPP